MVFRSFQRLPNLNAGISPSVMYRYSVSGEIPRYCDACRTFITSRDSFTRNATLASDHAQNLIPPGAPSRHSGTARARPVLAFMTSRYGEGQGILCRSCPKNTGSFRQLLGIYGMTLYI